MDTLLKLYLVISAVVSSCAAATLRQVDDCGKSSEDCGRQRNTSLACYYNDFENTWKSCSETCSLPQSIQQESECTEKCTGYQMECQEKPTHTKPNSTTLPPYTPTEIPDDKQSPKASVSALVIVLGTTVAVLGFWAIISAVIIIYLCKRLERAESANRSQSQPAPVRSTCHAVRYSEVRNDDKPTDISTHSSTSTLLDDK